MLVEEDMIDFIADRCPADTEAAIRKELENADSYASRFVRAWAAAAREALTQFGVLDAGEERHDEPARDPGTEP